MYQIHPQLVDIAQWRLEGEPGDEKSAFMPMGGAAPQGGAPGPQDAQGPPPGAGGPPGMPPGMPPTDPSMGAAGAGAMGAPPMGGPPPMDPMAGGMPPGGDPNAAPPDFQSAVNQAVQQALQQAGATPGAGGGAGGAGAGGKAKVDPALLYMELGRVRKLLTHLLEKSNIELPADILDDGNVARSLMIGNPMSQPLPGGGGGAGGGVQGGGPPGGNPLPNVPAAVAAKQASDLLFGREVDRVGTPVDSTTFTNMNQKLDVLASLARSLNRK